MMNAPMQTEEEKVERWKLEQFVELGFNGSEAGALLSWGVDPHYARYLLWRGKERTKCTHVQALEILRP